ncbi:Putative aminoglycoside phosphotransferase, protein kinase-like domain superfamily [Colletotrichum destructivum]|uniref:Aminoglycoside phosphotransferase, protein kinase-like domain superfamily n=1 Tax=Colletotrichum destructivum TaxID=34406 RepID=A0AAX4IGW8_9PEZI|nr:Putative aminoglycoside phosphotransferase, protein kinase-like domain superfamily [Colletotrichum destructivum]
MSAAKCDLFPDEKTLGTIFSGVDVKPADCNIISHTFDTCTFSIHPDTAALPGYPKDLLVRLEASSGRILHQIAAIQKLAQVQIPDLVPHVVVVGTTTTEDGRRVEYAVSEYFTGTIPLKEVWDTLGPDDQMHLVDSVASAMEKLQMIDHDIHEAGTQPGNAPIGGPRRGYFPEIKHFLRGILQESEPISRNCTLREADGGGVILESAFADIGRVELTNADLDDLKRHVVFCHNDLEPRNILVRPRLAERVSPRYDLAAIVDWEMAGFYPFAYEYGLKDNVLGLSNLSLSWYSLFKKRASRLLPQNQCHSKLIQALRVINQSKRRSMTRNVGVRFQEKWVAAHSIEPSLDIRRGWVRKPDIKAPVNFTKGDNENLELEVLRELGHV